MEVFERPHTEANYVTREMAFQLACRHGDRLRWLATTLLVVGPLLALPLAQIAPPAALLAGAFVERWLFFA